MQLLWPLQSIWFRAQSLTASCFPIQISMTICDSEFTITQTFLRPQTWASVSVRGLRPINNLDVSNAVQIICAALLFAALSNYKLKDIHQNNSIEMRFIVDAWTIAMHSICEQTNASHHMSASHRTSLNKHTLKPCRFPARWKVNTKNDGNDNCVTNRNAWAHNGQMEIIMIRNAVAVIRNERTNETTYGLRNVYGLWFDWSVPILVNLRVRSVQTKTETKVHKNRSAQTHPALGFIPFNARLLSDSTSCTHRIVHSMRRPPTIIVIKCFDMYLFGTISPHLPLCLHKAHTRVRLWELQCTRRLSPGTRRVSVHSLHFHTVLSP